MALRLTAASAACGNRPKRNAKATPRLITGQINMAEHSGPEKYALLGRPPSEMQPNSDQATANTREANNRELARRDASMPHPLHSAGAPGKDPTIESVDALIRRVDAMSTNEIDRVTRELESVRAIMRKEGERVTREIASYGSLNQVVTTAMILIAESVKHWKDASERHGGPRAGR